MSQPVHEALSLASDRMGTFPLTSGAGRFPPPRLARAGRAAASLAFDIRLRLGSARPVTRPALGSSPTSSRRRDEMRVLLKEGAERITAATILALPGGKFEEAVLETLSGQGETRGGFVAEA